MYRGRFQQGQEVPLSLLVLNSSGTPAAPDAAPTIRVYNQSGTAVYTDSVPVLDRFGQTGLFGFNLFLDERFPTGIYAAVYQWAVSSSNRADYDRFEVLAGGSRQGSIVSMEYYHRPQADFVVQSTFAGTVLKGRNPSV